MNELTEELSLLSQVWLLSNLDYQPITIDRWSMIWSALRPEAAAHLSCCVHHSLNWRIFVYTWGWGCSSVSISVSIEPSCCGLTFSRLHPAAPVTSARETFLWWNVKISARVSDHFILEPHRKHLSTLHGQRRSSHCKYRETSSELALGARDRLSRHFQRSSILTRWEETVQ